MERDLEPERVVVVDHPAAPVGEDPALGRAAAERLDDLLDVEAGLDGEDDALGDAEVGAGEDDLVDGLDRLAGTDRPDVGDRPARGRSAPDGRARRPARRRRRRSSASRSWRPRCRPTPARRPSRRPRSRSRAAKSQLPDGAIVEQSMTSVPGRAPSTTPSWPEQDGLDVWRVGDADDDHVPRPRRRRRATVAIVDPELGELRRAAGRPVPGGDREPGAREVGGHRRAHRAEPQEGDLLHRSHGTGSAVRSVGART